MDANHAPSETDILKVLLEKRTFDAATLYAEAMGLEMQRDSLIQAFN